MLLSILFYTRLSGICGQILRNTPKYMNTNRLVRGIEFPVPRKYKELFAAVGRVLQHSALIASVQADFEVWHQV